MFQLSLIVSKGRPLSPAFRGPRPSSMGSNIFAHGFTWPKCTQYAQVVLNCTSRVFTPSRGFAWLPMVSNGYHRTPIGVKWLSPAPNDCQCPPMLFDGPQSPSIVFRRLPIISFRVLFKFPSLVISQSRSWTAMAGDGLKGLEWA